MGYPKGPTQTRQARTQYPAPAPPRATRLRRLRRGFFIFRPDPLAKLEREGRAKMFRFDQLIRHNMVIRDVKQSHPETIPVFEELGFRSTCDDCDIETVARKNGISSQDVVAALNRAAFGSNAD